jgi:Flp pilus assembly protein TadB
MIEVAIVITLIVVVAARLRPLPGPRLPEPTRQMAPATARNGPVSRLGRPFRRSPAIDPTDLAGWCDGLARAVRGGSTLHHAVGNVAAPASIAAHFAPAVLALSRGSSLGAALRTVERGSAHVDLVLVVLEACAEHGGAPAEPIDRAAAALRQRAALELERRTQSAQARASAVVMTALPTALLGVLLLTSAPTRAAVASTPGQVSVVTGLACNAAGWAWMRHLVGGR